MAEAISVSGAVGAEDKVMSLETGKLAGLAGGSVVVSMGKTTVLVTATANSSVRPGTDFFPLTVDYEERSYAAGKIPGSFFRREGRASEQAILACRLTDRPLRPLFPEGFRNDVHIVATILGADQENPYDVISINAASAALSISEIPFSGPLGCVRIAYDQDGEWIAHPTYQEGEESTFEMVVAGRQLDDGDVAVMMVEAGGTENAFRYFATGAPKVDESVLADGLDFAKGPIKEAIALQKSAGRPGGRAPSRTMEFPTLVSTTPTSSTSAAGDGAGRGQAGRQVMSDRRQAPSAARPRMQLRRPILARHADRRSSRPPATRGPPTKQLKAAFRSLSKADRPQAASLRTTSGSTGASPDEIRPAVGRCRACIPPGARLRPVPAGRDPGAQRHHARHEEAWTR